MLQVNNISKTYIGVKALSDISFTVNKGTIVGLLGRNGAGKSTLMKILAGIINPDSGQALLSGADLLTDTRNLKKEIGYLAEENPLYQDMYVSEYLLYVAGIYHIKQDKVSEIIQKVGLEQEYKKKIGALSKGNKQRVGIAQALIHDPYLLIMDEPSSGLDPSQRESINNLLIELSKDKIILFSTHILSDVKDICKRFILIDKGFVVADQGVNEIGSIEETFYRFTNENSSR